MVTRIVLSLVRTKLSLRRLTGVASINYYTTLAISVYFIIAIKPILENIILNNQLSIEVNNGTRRFDFHLFYTALLSYR